MVEHYSREVVPRPTQGLPVPLQNGTGGLTLVQDQRGTRCLIPWPACYGYNKHHAQALKNIVTRTAKATKPGREQRIDKREPKWCAFETDPNELLLISSVCARPKGTFKNW